MARPRTTSDEAILEATGRALVRLGPGRLTLGGVAAEAGLSPATLVQRFGSKRGLLLAFARRAAHGARRPFDHARSAHPSPLRALRAALTAMASSVRTPEEMANNLGFLQLDLTPDFQEHAAAHASAVREQITDLLAEAARAGELASGVDAAALARAVQVTYNGTLILWALAPGDAPLADTVHADLDRLLAPYRPS